MMENWRHFKKQNKNMSYPHNQIADTRIQWQFQIFDIKIEWMTSENW